MARVGPGSARLAHTTFETYYLRMNADIGSGRRLPDDEVDLVVEVFRMLADATRVQVLWALVRGEMSVNDLASQVGKPAPSVSQHLAKLRMARLVRTRREGTTIFYSLGNDHIGQLVTDAVFNAEHAGPGVPGHHRDAAELATLHPDTTFTADSTPVRSTGRRA
jgi:DNA-binding transcriptional ArsR family regulator